MKKIKSFSIAMSALVLASCGGGSSSKEAKENALDSAKVFAVDVGRGQLDWKLRQDERVISMEKTNIRYVKPEDIGESVAFASVDVSFISLGLVLPAARELLTADGRMVCLIKPQFEAGREKVGKKGVVRDPAVHIEVIEKVIGIADQLHFKVLGLDYSPIKGPEGNIEYLIYLEKRPEDEMILHEKVDAKWVVEQSHTSL